MKSLDTPTAIIAIDCSPEPLLRSWYLDLREWMRSQPDLEVLWATFGHAGLDTVFLTDLRDPRHRLVLPDLCLGPADTYRCFDTCWVVGRSWPSCVWDRPTWGIQSLLTQHKRVCVQPRLLTHRTPEGVELPVTAEILADQLPQGVDVTARDSDSFWIQRNQHFEFAG